MEENNPFKLSANVDTPNLHPSECIVCGEPRSRESVGPICRKCDEFFKYYEE